MSFHSVDPFNDLPALPEHIETRAVLKTSIKVRTALAEEHLSGPIIPKRIRKSRSSSPPLDGYPACLLMRETDPAIKETPDYDNNDIAH